MVGPLSPFDAAVQHPSLLQFHDTVDAVIVEIAVLKENIEVNFEHAVVLALEPR